jgi:hypothetical protein
MLRKLSMTDENEEEYKQLEIKHLGLVYSRGSQPLSPPKIFFRV